MSMIEHYSHIVKSTEEKLEDFEVKVQGSIDLFMQNNNSFVKGSLAEATDIMNARKAMIHVADQTYAQYEMLSYKV